MKEENIAPCGINCSLCSAFQRKKNNCPGCNGIHNKPTYCKTCSIKMCTEKKNETEFCGLCSKYPCKRLKSLQKRYNQKYGVDIFDNLHEMNSGKITEFLTKEKQKWTCNNCGHLLCMHKANCITCNSSNPYYIGTRT
jgi:hypothetical protein